MKVLNPDKDPSKFFESLEKSRNRALLLDYDGTLAPFVVKRDKAFPYPEVPAVLKDIIQEGGTRLVIITGRGLDDIIPLLGLERTPEIWGSHGGERLLQDGTYQRAPLPTATSHGLESVVRWMEKMGWNDYVERKPLGVAIHWRGTEPPKVKAIQDGLLKVLPNFTAGTGLSIRAFDGGLELRPPEISKGEAVETILAEMGGQAVAAYLGDDLTDEDAFSAVKTCTSRGIGVLVREQLRDTKADLWLCPPEELLDFLRLWQNTAASSR
ncbi:MAG: trehalose-phosphatase [Desulfobacterales bacterium]|nr:MAG: trehalose-phosphatase [Desulfobacterales bacterium]